MMDETLLFVEGCEYIAKGDFTKIYPDFFTKEAAHAGESGKGFAVVAYEL